MKIQSIPWLHPFELNLPWEQLAICQPFPLPEDFMGFSNTNQELLLNELPLLLFFQPPPFPFLL